MKKISLFAAIAAMVFFVSCNKEQKIDDALVPNGTKVLIKVNDAEWTGDTKTAYTPGVGVSMTGTELMSLYYHNGERFNADNNDYIKAEPEGAGYYSFIFPAAATGFTHWYGVMPYSRQLNSYNSTGTAVRLHLGPVQFPGANTFDPMADYLVAQPFDVSGTTGADETVINSFKRLFAPLCLAITGLESGDKIYTATLKLSQEPTGTSALCGFMFLAMDDTYAGTYVNGVNAESNALTAEYADGLAAVGDNWPVWLMVNPITIEAGCNLTLTVSTADKTYTRTVTLPAAATLSTSTLNRITINIKGEGYTVAESVTQDFTEQMLTGTQTLTASDGSSLTWVSSISNTFTSAGNDDGSGITGAMYAHKSFTFPTIPGKLITGARIVSHPASRYGGTAATATLTVDGTDVYPFNMASYASNEGLSYNGGVVDIALPAGRTTLSGLSVVPTTQQNLISAITLFTADDPAFANDYYAQYEAGLDVTINGAVFNKATNGAARLLKLYEMANSGPIIADYSTNGILFLDYDEADAKTDELNISGYWLQPNDIVIIGRYRNHQPHINITDRGINAKGPSMQLKNVKLSTYNPMYTANITSSYLDLNIEDCTIVASNNFLLCENSSSKGFRNIVINNSVIKIVRSLYEVQGVSQIASGSNLGLEKFWLTNSVVYAASEVNYPTIALRTASSVVWYTPNLDLKFENNTFYNLANNNLGLIALGNMAKLNVNFNVGDAPLPKNSPIFMLHAQLASPISDSYIRHNHFNERSGSFNWSACYSAATNSGVTIQANYFTQSTSPFTSVDTSTGYFPVNTTDITDGAGASYATKYWNNWGE